MLGYLKICCSVQLTFRSLSLGWSNCYIYYLLYINYCIIIVLFSTKLICRMINVGVAGLKEEVLTVFELCMHTHIPSLCIRAFFVVVLLNLKP